VFWGIVLDLAKKLASFGTGTVMMNQDVVVRSQKRHCFYNETGSYWYSQTFPKIFPSPMIEESLDVKLPTIWTNEKAEVGGVRKEKRKSQKKKSREALCFSNVLWLGGSKSRLAKAAGVEPSGEMRDEKLHAVVARSRLGSQTTKNTSLP
jgi:hypothetical protein